MTLLITVTGFIWIPLIPLRLLIQIGSPLWRRLGDISYFVFLLFWAGIDMLLYSYRPLWTQSGWRTFPHATPLGIVIILFALFFGFWTVKTLGFINLSLRPQISPKKISTTLISTGPYALIRHPFYFTEWLILLGLALITQSWLVLSLLIAALLIDPVVTVFEEKELMQRFSDYSEYQKRVPRLFPTRFLAS